MDRKEPLLLKRIGKMRNPASVEEYIGLGGFAAITKAVNMSKEDILQEVDDANLRGRGGAAYPAGRKWRHLYGVDETPKYIVCNADEGEPGTFKDKMLLGQDPLSVIEGMLIAGYLFDSHEGFIYIRGEYRAIQAVFQEAIDAATKAGYLGSGIMGIKGFDYTITIVSGAGAYVCGENSALLNSVEGKTGRPRVKPPHLAEVGLYLKPTLVNNVESFACIPAILTMGGKAFLAMGAEDGGGTKLVSISGHGKIAASTKYRWGRLFMTSCTRRSTAAGPPRASRSSSCTWVGSRALSRFRSSSTGCTATKASGIRIWRWVRARSS